MKKNYLKPVTEIDFCDFNESFLGQSIKPLNKEALMNGLPNTRGGDNPGPGGLNSGLELLWGEDDEEF